VRPGDHGSQVPSDGQDFLVFRFATCHAMRDHLRKIAWFGVVGIVSTVFYVAAAALALSWLSWPPLRASTVGYLTAMCGSYFGHKILTFRSDALHRRAMPRFVIQAAVGYALAQGITYSASKLGLRDGVGIAAVAVALPALNFLLLQFWVFATRSRRSARDYVEIADRRH
jgi:putative flippase GtrA